MAANTQPIFVKSANNAEVTFVNGDGTTAKDLVSAATDGTKIFAINVTSDDTSARIMQVLIHDGTTAYLIGSVNVPTLAGTDGTTPAVNLLDPTQIPGLDADGELFLKTGYKLQCKPTVAVTAAKTVSVVCLGADY